jgi:hypothetical protein
MKNIIKSLILQGNNYLESLVLEESTGNSIHYFFTMKTEGEVLADEEISLFRD